MSGGLYFGALLGTLAFALACHLHIAARTGWRGKDTARVAILTVAIAYTALNYLEGQAADLGAHVALLRAQAPCEAAIFIAIVEYNLAYSGERRGAGAKALYGALAALAVLQVALPNAGTYGRIDGLASVPQPWGARTSAVAGSPSALVPAKFVLTLAAVAAATVPLIRLRRRGGRNLAGAFIASEIALAAGICFDLAATYGLVARANAAETAYLLIVLVQSFDATEEAIESKELKRALELTSEEKDRLIREVRRKESELAHAVQMAALGSWEYDVAADTFTFTDEFYAIFRTSAAEVGGYRMSSADYARRFVHPDDAHLVADEIRKTASCPRGNCTSQVEHRILYADGAEGVIVVRIFLERGDDGKVAHTFGVNQDISERKLAEERLRRSLAEKEALLRELHHRTKNNMEVIISLLDLQARSSRDEGLRRALGQAEDRIHSMALAHQKLYESDDLSEIDLRKYVSDLGSYLLSSCAVSPDQVSFALEAEDIRVPLSIAVPCGLVINELFTNAIAHAFPDGRKGTISARLSRPGCGIIRLEISDDGIGVPAGFDPGAWAHMGLLTVKSLGETQLGGKVEFSTAKGFGCAIEFSEECCE